MNLKKIFTMGVVMTTILWSLGVATLVPSVANAMDTSCPTLVAGDMIKVSGKPAIYVLDNNLKYRYFSDGDVFKSWNADEAYSKYYKTISQACFDSLMQPAAAPYHVFYRNGSEVVKYLSSDTLYVVGLNNVLYPITDAAAKAIFGATYKVKIIGLSEWPYYTKDTTTITEASVYPGALVKVDGKTYFVDTGKVLREVDAAGMTANRFKAAYVRTLPTSAIAGLTMGAAISAEVPTIASRLGTAAPVIPTASGKLTVSLAMDTPAAASVPQNGTRVPFVKVNLTAGSDNAINVDALTVKRTGLSDYNMFAGTAGSVWAEKNGARVSSQADMNSSDEVNLTFSPVLNIPAGQTVTLEIVASLNAAAGNGALGISAATAVSAGGVTVAGSFPIFGNLMSFTSYDVATAYVDFNTSAKAPKVGDTAAELASFDVQQTATSSKDIIFKSIMLRNTGNEDMAKILTNVYLEKAGAMVSGYGVIDGRYITFTLNNGGLLIEKGDTMTFKVKGDIVAKENASTPSLTFLVNKTEDISIIEKSTGFGAAVTKDTDTNNVNITSGALSITKKTTQPADTDVIKGTTGSVSLLANVRADEAIKADGVKVEWTGTSVTSSFQNAKVYMNGFLLGSFDPDANTGIKEIESAVTFNKGDNELKITVDAKTDATSAANIKFFVTGGNFVNGEAPEYVASGNSVSSGDINGSPNGAIISIEGAALTVSRNDGYSTDRKIVYGTSDVVIGKFNVKAENDAVTITSIEAAANSGSGTKVADSSVYDMKIFADGVQVGSTRDFNASGAAFSGLNVVINKDQIKSFEVKASFDTAATGSIATVLTFNNQDSRGKSLSAKTGTTVNQIVIDSGTLTVAAGADTRDASIILAKSGIEHEVAQFKLTSQDDLSNITEMTIVNSSTLPSDSRVSAVKLYKGTTLIGTDFMLNNSTTIKINTNALIVAANSNETVTLKVVLNTIDTADQSSSTFRANLKSLKYKGSAGTELTKSLDVYGNNMQIRKTMPTLAAVSLGSTGSQQTQEEVLKFTVTADANEDVYITSLTVVEVGTATSSVSHFKLYEGSTEKKDITSGLVFDMSATPLVVGKGTTKTYTVKADTSGVAVDATYGLSLEKGSGSNNILWAEYFVAGNNPGNAEYIFTLPIANTKKY
ncbi:MAG TPA: hypothetical protein P5230_01230 [Candidatus Magasanikbacteria bacterium]|nr:hypothetical protein [Candidatus Magasanikbacteria bacterium]